MKFITFLIIFIFLSNSSFACWSNKYYEIISLKALILMPKPFYNVFKNYKKELLSGSIESVSPLNSIDHYLSINSEYGKADFRIRQLADKIVYDINHHVPFSIISREFGNIAHYISDLNNPLHTEPASLENKSLQKELDKFFYKNVEKIPFVFYGYTSKFLEEENIKDFSLSIANRSNKLLKVIKNSLINNGEIKDSDNFDEKSFLFGSIAVSYQHSISDTVQIWLYIWKNAHGDISNLPLKGSL